MIVIPDKLMIKDDFAPTKSGKREIDPRPEFSINATEFPDIKDWSVGKKYKIEIEAEMTGSRIGEYGEDKGKLTGTFRISGIMADSDKDEKEEDYDSRFPKGMQEKKKK